SNFLTQKIYHSLPTLFSPLSTLDLTSQIQTFPNCLPFRSIRSKSRLQLSSTPTFYWPSRRLLTKRLSRWKLLLWRREDQVLHRFLPRLILPRPGDAR